MTPIQQKSYLAEVNLPNTAVGTQINFGFIPQLEGAEIYGIQSFGRADIHASPNQKTMVPAAGLPSLYVTFVIGEEEKLYRVPVTDLNNNFNKGIIRMFANQKINFTKSYVTINSATSLTAGESICFTFIYKK